MQSDYRATMMLHAAAAFMLLGVFAALPAVASDSRPIVLMWQVTGDAYSTDFPVLRDLGITDVQSFSLSQQSAGYVTSYLDAALKAGVGVIPFVGGSPKRRECGLTSRAEAFVRVHAKNPAIKAWHTVDEPAGGDLSKECQRSIYRAIKAIDPTHPILVSINFRTQPQYDSYFAEDAFDILDLHKYVNPHIGRAQKELIELFKKNRTRSYPVIVTLRAFHGPEGREWKELVRGTLTGQFAFFFEERRITDNVGFYGWRLAPNRGIAQIEWLRAEFEQFAKRNLIPSKAASSHNYRDAE